jgi:germination protein YpeB
VTKTGGHLLMMMSEGIVGEQQLSKEEMRDIAVQFLEDHGFTDMQWTFEQVNGEQMVFNFVATQNDVLLYPDLIKVQVSSLNGKVVAFECDAYLRNHSRRILHTPNLSEDEAKLKIGLLDILDTKLCIIPLDMKEIYCYQFLCTQGDNTYLIYVNALNGDEENILLVVGDENSRVVI